MHSDDVEKRVVNEQSNVQVRRLYMPPSISRIDVSESSIAGSNSNRVVENTAGGIGTGS